MAAQPFSDLPPLPKSLSALVSSSNNQWKEMQRLYAMKVTLQEDLDKASAMAFQRPARTTSQLRRSAGSDKVLGSFNLGSAVSHLRKEMSNLRQMDASLFCQLMLVSDSLNELKASAAAAAEERDRPLSNDTLDAFSENDELTTYDSSGEEAFSDTRQVQPATPTARLHLDINDQHQQQPSDVQVIKLHDGKKIYLLKRETLC